MKKKGEDFEKFSLLLLELQRRLKGDVSMMSAEALGSDADSGDNRAPIHPAEVGTHSFEQEFTLIAVEQTTAIAWSKSKLLLIGLSKASTVNAKSAVVAFPKRVSKCCRILPTVSSVPLTLAGDSRSMLRSQSMPQWVTFALLGHRGSCSRLGVEGCDLFVARHAWRPTDLLAHRKLRGHSNSRQ